MLDFPKYSGEVCSAVHMFWEGHKTISHCQMKLGDFFKLLWLSQNIWTLTQISVSPLKFFTWNNFCLIFPNIQGKSARQLNYYVAGLLIKKLEFLCEINWQSNKIPAVTIYHTQHWTYQLYEQLLLAIVYKHPMALVPNGAKKIFISYLNFYDSTIEHDFVWNYFVNIWKLKKTFLV